MKITFKQHLIEQMGGMNPQNSGASSIEDMTPEELIKIAKMKRSNPKLANVELIKRIREQLKTVQDPKQRSTLQMRLKQLTQG